MTRDQIKKWEDEAHNYADHVTCDNPDADWNAVFHERFSFLARADEREACAKVCDGLNEHAKADECAAAIRSRKD